MVKAIKVMKTIAKILLMIEHYFHAVFCLIFGAGIPGTLVTKSMLNSMKTNDFTIKRAVLGLIFCGLGTIWGIPGGALYLVCAILIKKVPEGALDEEVVAEEELIEE